jgi:flagellar hook-associated protein 3 FlgL
MVSLESNSLYYLNILNTQSSKVNYQLSTGNAIENGSDDSSLFKEIISLESKMNRLESIQIQIDTSTLYNESSDSTISQMKDIMDTVNSKVLLALNDTNTIDDKKIIANELEAYKESLLNYANQNDGDNYFFSGLDSTKQAFVESSNGNIVYNGSLDNKKLLVDENSYATQGVTGVDILYYTTSTASTGEDLTFLDNDLLIDSQNNTWEFIDYDLDGNIDTDRVYKNADSTSDYIDVTYDSSSQEYTLTNTQNETIETKHSYFDLLDEIINSLNLKDSNGNSITEEESDEILSSKLDDIENAYDTINEAHSKLGSRNSIIETAATSLSAKYTSFNIFYEQTASADLTEASIKAQSLELTFSALYSTISKLNSLSLVNYI